MTNAHHPLDTLIAQAAGLGLVLDPPQLDGFARYLGMVLEWNERAGLTSADSPEAIQRRHFGESLALLAALRRAGVALEGARVADLGPGGGFPSLPMAIVERRARFVLVESNRRRAEFLGRLSVELALSHVEVVQTRAEDAARDAAFRASFDLVLARALAPLRVLVELAVPFLRPGGTFATPKGSRAEQECREAEGALAALGATIEARVPLALPPDAPPQTVVLVRRTGVLDDRYPRRAGIPAKRPL